jgi:hypothetical protein
VAGAATTGLPTTSSAFQTACAGPSGSNDAFFAKIDPALSGTASLVYASYLGGGENFGDAATAIAVDGAGNTYLEGYTSSSDGQVSCQEASSEGPSQAAQKGMKNEHRKRQPDELCLHERTERHVRPRLPCCWEAAALVRAVAAAVALVRAAAVVVAVRKTAGLKPTRTFSPEHRPQKEFSRQHPASGMALTIFVSGKRGVPPLVILFHHQFLSPEDTIDNPKAQHGSGMKDGPAWPLRHVQLTSLGKKLPLRQQFGCSNSLRVGDDRRNSAFFAYRDKRGRQPRLAW